MMKNIKHLLIAIAVTIFSVVAVPATALAATASSSEACQTLQDFNPNNKGCSQADGGVNGLIRTAVQVLSAIAGIIAVIMLIIAGLSYVTSNGDSNKISHAKNTLLYAIVGLVIVVFSQLIVQFVLTRGVESQQSATSGASSPLKAA